VAKTRPCLLQRKQNAAENRALELAVRPGRSPTQRKRTRKRTPKKENRLGVKEPLSELRSHFTTNQMQRQKRVLYVGHRRSNFEAAKSIV
jgi:hypothetical protein